MSAGSWPEILIGMEDIKNDIQGLIRDISKCATSGNNHGWTELYARTDLKLRELKERPRNSRDKKFVDTYIELCAARTIIEIFKEEKEKS